jgi:coatomer protein complex subunit alpha (xenin)
VTTTREYLLAVILETTRSALSPDDHKRNLELVSYFTHCKMLPQHSMLALRRGIQLATKAKNHVTATRFARRLIDLNPDKATVTKVNIALHKIDGSV